MYSLKKKTNWRRKWQPTPVFLPGKSHRQSSLAGYSPWGLKRVGHDLATKQQPSIHSPSIVIGNLCYSFGVMLNNLFVNMWIQSTNWFALGASEASSLRNAQVSLGRGMIYESGITTTKSRSPPRAKVRGVRTTRGDPWADAQDGDRAKGWTAPLPQLWPLQEGSWESQVH